MSESQPTLKRASVTQRQARSILTKASGFIGAFDYTLNPYSGCAFGCVYCYAAFFAHTDEKHESWGSWVEVKENALDLLRKWRKKPLAGKTIYMSSVTDPYQPIEARLGLTRAILEELLAYHQPRLVIQTRGPLITRDLDLLRQFAFVQVNMTVTTDDESIRKAFEPTCPSTEKRLAAIAEVQAAGVPSCITLTPLLPLRAPDSFAERLAQTGVPRFVVQAFHSGQVRFAAGTGEQARHLAQSLQWDRAAYEAACAVLRGRLPNLREGRDGFTPHWLD